MADISLADWGRKTITLAEKEMPGLMYVFVKAVVIVIVIVIVILFVVIVHHPHQVCFLDLHRDDLAQVPEAEIRTFQAVEGSQDCWMSAHDCPGQ